METQTEIIHMTDMCDKNQDNVGIDNEAYVDEIQQQQTRRNEDEKETETGMIQNGSVDGPLGCCSRHIETLQMRSSECYKNNRRALYLFVSCVVIGLYFIYFGYAMYFSFGDEGSTRLLVLTSFGVCIISIKMIQRLFGKQLETFYENTLMPNCKTSHSQRILMIIGWMLKISVSALLIGYIVVDVAVYYPANLMSIAGQLIYILLFYITSTNPSKIKWHPVFWGFVLQYAFAILILRWYWGYQIFKWIGDRMTEFLAHADEGAKFVFGDNFEEHFFAFKVMSIVVFVYSINSLLYYLGVMQAVVRLIGRFLAFCMGTTAAETLSTAANIFMGMTDSPLLVRPFLKDMTISELHAVMTGGFATIAGSVMGAYINFGVPANHLMSASVMSAPAALAISKLACPETEVSKASAEDFYRSEKAKDRSVIEALSNGAVNSIKLAGAISVNIIAFVSALKLFNSTLEWFGDRVGMDALSMEFICSYVLFPVSFFMGADVKDCRKLAELIGIKTFTNEFIAYKSLSTLISNKRQFMNYTSIYNNTGDWFYKHDDIVLKHVNSTLVGGILTNKSEIIATYALCGFSNFGSIGILLGGVGALAPSRKSDMSSIVLRAMIAGNVACFLTACIAGLLYKEY